MKNDVEHYAVIVDWAQDGDYEISVIGITHTLEEAKEIFNDRRSFEKRNAEESGWTVTLDENFHYEVSSEKNCDEYAHLWIQGVL